MNPDPDSDGTSSEEEEERLGRPGASPSDRKQPGLGSVSSSTGETATSASVPVQKRRRVTRACDECRRKKIKCDGKQPCTHCTVYSYECTYDQPSNRRRNPAPAYVEALEGRLQKAQVLLNNIAPGVNLADPRFDSQSIDQIIASARCQVSPEPDSSSRTRDSPEKNPQMQSIVEATGSLDQDDQGNWDYHGNSSSFVFMHNLRSQFGALAIPDPRIQIFQRSTFSHLVESPTSVATSRVERSRSPATELPDRETAYRLCRNTLDIACALMGFMHRPKFFSRLDQLYDTVPDRYTNANIQFLPLLYMCMAVGCLFTPSDESQPEIQHQVAAQQGYVYFQTARSMLNIPDCRNLVTLQAIIFKIMFLQASARLSTCYSYIGIAARTCCRLGMHRDVNRDFDLIEREERKRAFWLIRALDAYVSALLGLPQLLSEDDVDQPLPLEMSDDFITATAILPAPAGRFHSTTGQNALTKLMWILLKVVRHVYPIKSQNAESQERYLISQSKVREIETDMQAWMDALPSALRPTESAGSEMARAQQLLRFTYAHLQMMLYRPFLHFVSQRCQSENLDRRSYACAAACVSVTRNLVHIATEMKRRGLLSGSQWFVVYTTYLAVVSLVYFVFENPSSNSARDIMKDAAEGKSLLASLSKESSVADRCYHSLVAVFNELPAKLQERKATSRPTPVSRKRTTEDVTADAGFPSSSTQGDGSRTAREGIPAGPTRSRRSNQNSGSVVPRHQESQPNSVLPHEHWASKPMSLDPSNDARGSHLVSDSFQPPTSASASFPDLTGLMYPSANPFEYGNQPLSTLEESQALKAESVRSEPEALPLNRSQFGQQPTFMPQPEHAWPSSSEHVMGVRAEELNTYHMPPRPPGMDPSIGSHPTFWQQLAQGPPGLTPGVGMDDIFGSGNWNALYQDPEPQGYGQ